MEPVDLKEPRYDQMNRRLCSAHRKRSDELCNAPAVTGMDVCRIHGGASPQAQRNVRMRLLELLDPAVATLAEELDNPSAEVRLKAANSILDRGGMARATKVETSDAKAILIERMLEIRARNMAAEPDVQVLEGHVLEPGET